MALRKKSHKKKKKKRKGKYKVKFMVRILAPFFFLLSFFLPFSPGKEWTCQTATNSCVFQKILTWEAEDVQKFLPIPTEGEKKESECPRIERDEAPSPRTPPKSTRGPDGAAGPGSDAP